jgi:hypothetical protein
MEPTILENPADGLKAEIQPIINARYSHRVRCIDSDADAVFAEIFTQSGDEAIKIAKSFVESVAV